MSSTTERRVGRRAERGQVLVLFAGSAAVLFIIAALAFDVGVMLLERRDQQNAADAAALAGARYVLAAGHGTTDCATVSGGAPGADSPGAAAWAACAIAAGNGTGDNETVVVHVPPLHGAYRGLPGFIEVEVDSAPSGVFSGIIGRTDWSVGVSAVAANQQGVLYSFGMLALDPEACKAILISGTGTVESAANVQANSTGAGCGDGSNIGFSRTGGGVLNVTAPDAVCRSGGEIQDQGAGSMTCTPAEYSFALPDPLRNLPAPAKPALAPSLQEVVAGVVQPSPSTIPDYCPGATDAATVPSESTPRVCVLGQGGAQANRLWILSPGLYPGGLELKGGVTAFLLPGIYWIGGGGFATSNNASVISVESADNRAPAVCTQGATPPCTGGGGVLLYNSLLAGTGGGAPGPITLGGGGAILNLQPYAYPFGDSTIDLVIFQDRTVSLNGDDVTLNGSTADAYVRGIIYLPRGDLKVNGSSSQIVLDQIIANTFKINGNGGMVKVLRETGVDAEISAVGLVE